MATVNTTIPTCELIWATMGPRGEAILMEQAFPSEAAAFKFAEELEDTLEEGTFEILATATIH